VNNGLRVYNPRDEGAWFDSAGVVEKFGVRPDQVVDVLALMGDSIDNIKGVPGIGEKGARELISTFRSLDAVLGAAPTLTPKRRDALVANAEQARASRELARIRTDVPVTFDPDAVRYRGPSRERCFTLFSSLGFRSLVAEFAPTAQSVVRDYAVVTSLEDVDALAAEIRNAGQVALAAIAPAASPVQAHVVGWSFATAPGKARYIPVAHSGLGDTPNLPSREVFARLGPVLADPQIRKIGHDLKFIGIAAAREGVTLAGDDVDTMIESYLADATRSNHDIEGLALERTNYRALTESDVTSKGVKAVALDAVPATSLVTFAAERADLPLAIAAGLAEDVKTAGLDAVYHELELPL